MSAYVNVYVKPNCKESKKLLDMVLEYGGIDTITIVGDANDEATKVFGEEVADYADGVEYISEDAEELQSNLGGEPLPQVCFDSFNIGYAKALEAYESGDLDMYFT